MDIVYANQTSYNGKDDELVISTNVEQRNWNAIETQASRWADQISNALAPVEA